MTLRQADPADVVWVAAAAELECIEWGADVHVPPGDALAARAAAEQSAAAGLRVASYGSYFRAGVHDSAEFAPVLEQAAALGAPRVRVWPGAVSSAQASPAERGSTVVGLQEIAAMAARAEIEVGMEFHPDTLADTSASAVQLVEQVGAGHLRTYWQPPVGMPDAEALAGLRQVLPMLSSLHVFSWGPGGERLPLAARSPLWRDAFELVVADGRPHDALLEFVEDDSQDNLTRDAGTARQLLADLGP